MLTTAFALLMLMVFGCGHDRDNPEVSTSSDLVELRQAFSQEKISLQSIVTPTLYSPVNDCDWTLWCGIAQASGLTCDLDQVEYPSPGYIQRRPVNTCWDGEDRGSKSTTSNDAITGYVLGRWRSGDRDAIRRVFDYGKAHGWVMGEPLARPGEVILKPQLQALMALMTGGDALPYQYVHVAEDYAQHVQMIQIMVWGEADSGSRLLSIDDQMLARIEENAAGSPEDYFFQAVKAVYDGSYDAANALLLRRYRGEVPSPSYVRGERQDLFARLHWLLAADLVLRHQAKG